MSEQPSALDPATLRWAADMVPRAPGDTLSVATWLRALAAQAEQQAATPPDVRETAERDQDGAIRGDCCEHGVIWHHERRGCGYLGFGGGRCACLLTHDEALAGVLASTPRPEGETRVEWNVQARARDGSKHTGRALTSRAEAEMSAANLRRVWDIGGAHPAEMETIRVARRTVTSFPDVVGEWVPVEQDGDDR